MKLYVILYYILFLILSFGIIGFMYRDCHAEGIPKTPMISILTGGETLGNLESCACPRGNIPGMGQRAYEALRVRKEHPRLVLLDSGNFVEETTSLDRVRARYIIEAMNLMDYSALCLGDRDLLLGLDYLKELRSIARFPFLSANLIGRVSRNPLFDTHTLLEIPVRRQNIDEGSPTGVVRVFIIGVLGTEHQTNIEKRNPGIEILEPAEVIKEAISSSPEKPDVVIVLARTKVHKAKRLLRSLPEVDILIASDERTVSENVRYKSGDKEQFFVTTVSHGMKFSLLPLLETDGNYQVGTYREIDISPDSPPLADVERVVSEYRKEAEQVFKPKKIPENKSPETLPMNPGPNMLFYESEYDFGTVESEETQKHDLIFRNHGEKPLKIEKVLSTCECLKVHLESKDVIIFL